MRALKLVVILTTLTLLASCSQVGTRPEQQRRTQDIIGTTDAENFTKLFDEAEGQSPTNLDNAKVQESLKKIGTSITMLEAVAVPPCPLPSRIGGLRDGTDFQIYKFDSEHSAGANALGFEGSVGKKEMVFIQDFRRYGDIACADGTKRVGIGLRCFIHVTQIKGKVGYNGLSGIAANVELNNARATYMLKSFGFPLEGSVLAEGLQTAGDYTVENFGKLSATFANTLRVLNSNSPMEIHPIVLP